MSLWVLMLGLLALTGAAVPAEEDSGAEGHGAERDGEVPVLEPGTQEEKVRQIRFGETVKLDDIGPIIVNADCSMRRISNYDALTQREKVNPTGTPALNPKPLTADRSTLTPDS